jgi:tetratricopeptide (TPR) repeat protein
MTPKSDRAKIESIAEKHIKRGRLDEAIAEYRKLLTGDDQDIAIRNILGDLYIKADNKKKAVEEFERIAAFYEDKGLYSKAIAIYKRIKRLIPDNIDSSKRLAELYRDQGFSSEAKTEFLNLAQSLSKAKKVKEAIGMYENLLKLDRDDLASRLTLAELYTEEKMIDQALEELNKVAEFKMRKNQLKEAGEILNKAKALKEDHSRTITNLIDLYKRDNKKKEALDLVEEILQKDEKNLKALYILGNLHFEDKSFKEAGEIFSRIISIRPKDVEARVKLGRIYIQTEEFDKAFEQYEPLVDTLIRKQKSDKAIGLLGLILSAQKAHLPTLGKLADLYKSLGQLKNFELVCKVILDEYRKNNQKDKMLSVLNELLNTFPEHEDYYNEAKRLKKDLGILEKEGAEEEAEVQVEEAKNIVDSTLAKADLYVDQGLIRNARRLLENLRIKFPEDERIAQKIESLKIIAADVKVDEISDRVDKVTKRETQIFPTIGEISKEEQSFVDEAAGEEKLTAADIFVETDIIPIVSEELGDRKYYDLAERIATELEAISSTTNNQIKGDTTIVEKALSDIVTEFRKVLDEKVDKEDYESHYNLGVVFLEQGLFDEAIEECKLAAEDENLAIESYSIISFCYRQKKDYKEAMKWLDKAKGIKDKDMDQEYALKYELASLYEDMNDAKNALKIYDEVKKWNPEFRDVAERIKSLQSKK